MKKKTNQQIIDELNTDAPEELQGELFTCRTCRKQRRTRTKIDNNDLTTAFIYGLPWNSWNEVDTQCGDCEVRLLKLKAFL